MNSLLSLLLLVAAEPVSPAAAELFERDTVLSAWALSSHDRNRDGWLTSYEAQGAVAAFKELADADRDGRVSVREFEEAKRFIVARGTPGPKVAVIR